MRLHQGILLWVLALPVLAGAGFTQAGRRPTPRTWTRTYGGPFAEGLLDLRQAPDGSVRAAAWTDSFGASGAGGWLLHLDAVDGEPQLERVCSNAASGVVDGAGLAADGGALFTGRTVVDLFTRHDGWVVRVDARGDVVWSRGFTRKGFGRHFLFDAAELADGSWIAAGATSLVDRPPQAAWLVRLTRDGGLDWQYEYGGGVADSAVAVVATSDGGFVVAGATNSSGSGADDAWIMKVDSAGVIEWQRTYGGSDQDQATAVVELGSGGFAVAAYTNSFTASGHAPWVLRLNAGGELLWHAVVGDGEWGDLYSVAETRDGQVIALGRVSQTGYPTNDLWAVKLAAADGAVLWQRAYAGDSGDWGSVVLPLSTGGLLLGGTWGWGFPEEELWLLHTDSSGRLPGCGLMRDTAFVITRPLAGAQAGVAVRRPAGAMPQATSFDVAPGKASVVDRCSR